MIRSTAGLKIFWISGVLCFTRQYTVSPTLPMKKRTMMQKRHWERRDCTRQVRLNHMWNKKYVRQIISKIDEVAGDNFGTFVHGMSPSPAFMLPH